jgi:hypothetical protein
MEQGVVIPVIPVIPQCAAAGWAAGRVKQQQRPSLPQSRHPSPRPAGSMAASRVIINRRATERCRSMQFDPTPKRPQKRRRPPPPPSVDTGVRLLYHPGAEAVESALNRGSARSRQ